MSRQYLFVLRQVKNESGIIAQCSPQGTQFSKERKSSAGDMNPPSPSPSRFGVSPRRQHETLSKLQYAHSILSGLQSTKIITTSDSRISQATGPCYIDPRDAPAHAISPLLDNGADSVVFIISMPIASNVAVSVKLNRFVCVAVLTACAMHGQAICGAALSPHV